MSSIRVIIRDQTGARRQPAELPADVPMSRLVPALVSKMGLPINVTYTLDYPAGGHRLTDDETLANAKVMQDEELVILPEVTAGSFERQVL
jgi:hypothetical protein